jgi:hypothetical protein
MEIETAVDKPRKSLYYVIPISLFSAEQCPAKLRVICLSGSPLAALAADSDAADLQFRPVRDGAAFCGPSVREAN